MKKRRNIVILLVILLLSVVSYDLNNVNKGNPPLFTLKIIANDSSLYIGPLYYFKEEVRTAPSQEFSFSPKVEFGVWLFPGFTVYRSNI